MHSIEWVDAKFRFECRLREEGLKILRVAHIFSLSGATRIVMLIAH